MENGIILNVFPGIKEKTFGGTMPWILHALSKAFTFCNSKSSMKVMKLAFNKKRKKKDLC